MRIKELLQMIGIVLISVFCFGSMKAQNYQKLEAEDFTDGYNTGNVSIVEPITYSGGKYTIVTGEHGEPMLPISVDVTGTYTIRAYYHGGSNTHYNLYDSNASTKLSDGRIADLGSLGYYELVHDLDANTTYYFGIYGNTGTIYDYVEVLDSGENVVCSTEAEDFTLAYLPDNITIEAETSVSYSGGKYTIVTGSDGEPALQFTVSTNGTYTIKVSYHGGSGLVYNLYEDAVANNNKINEGSLEYKNQLGYYEFEEDLTVGTNYYIGVYGNTGTIFDCAEITLKTPDGPDDPDPRDSDTTPVSDPKALVMQAENAGYDLGAELATLPNCERSYVKIQYYDTEGSPYVKFTNIPTSGTYNIYIGYAAPNGDARCRLLYEGNDLNISPFTLEKTTSCINEKYIGQVTFSEQDHLDISVNDDNNGIAVYIDYIRITEENAYVWSPELNPDSEADLTDWTNTGNWDLGRERDAFPQTVATDDVIIPAGDNYPILNAAATCKSITFQPGAEIGNQHLLTGTISASVKMNLSTGRWYMLSMPMNVSNLMNFYLYDSPSVWFKELTVNDDNGNVKWNYITNAGTGFANGKGFAYKVGSTPGDTQEIVVKGTLPTSSSLIGIDLNFGEDAAYSSSSHFALAGNPFMTTIDFEVLQRSSGNDAGITENYLVWTKNGFVGYSPDGQFGAVGGAGTNIDEYIIDNDDRKIPPLQSFIVEKTSLGEGTLTIDLTVTDLQATGKSKAGLRSAKGASDKLNIIASNDAGAVLTFIAKRDNGQSARKLKDVAGDMPDIYTLAGTTALGAQIINTNDIVVPLGILTSREGDITLTFTGMDTYDESTDIKLLDKTTGAEIALTGETESYTFSHTPQETIEKDDKGKDVTAIVPTENRLFIALSPAVAMGTDNASAQDISVYYKDNAICALSPASDLIDRIYVYDVQGRLVYANEELNTPVYVANVQGNIGDVFIVKLITENNAKNAKVVVTK